MIDPVYTTFKGNKRAKAMMTDEFYEVYNEETESYVFTVAWVSIQFLGVMN